jgi:hypothetical protein
MFKNIIKFLYSISCIFIFCFISFVNCNFAQTPQLFGNFPLTYQNPGWPYLAESLPIPADFRGDGSTVIAVGAKSSYSNPKMYLIDLNGNVLPGWPKTFLFNTGSRKEISSTAAGDINNDGKIELVVNTPDSLFVLDYTNKNIPGFPVFFPSPLGTNTLFALSLYDLENNGLLNIIVCAGNRIIVFNSDGSIKNGWPVSIGYKAVFGSGISVGDLNGDNKAEILTSSFIYGWGNPHDSNFIRIYDRNGNNFPGWPVFSDSNYTISDNQVTIKPDKNYPSNSSVFVVSFIADTVSAPDYNRITIYDINGNIKKRWYHNQNMVLFTPIVADLNSDGQDELFTGYEQYYSFLFTMEGNLLPGWPQWAYHGFMWQSNIGKVKYGNQLFCINRNTGFLDSNHNSIGEINAYNFNGTQASGWPLLHRGDEMGMTLYDLNHDGSVELIFTSWAPHTSNNSEAILYIYTIPGIPYTKEDFPWPMFAHDRYRTNQLGFVPPDEPIGIIPISNNIPGQFVLYQNYPNPFNPSTKIKFEIPQSVILSGEKNPFVKLIVYNTLGQEVTTLINEHLKIGTYEVVWPAPSGDGSSYSSGVYYYQLRAGNYIDTKKLVLIK